jgi:hypothetical protein
MVLSTSDRVKSIAANIERRHVDRGPEMTRRLQQLKFAERRVLLIVRALTALYFTVAPFVTACLVALFGEVLFVSRQEILRQVALIVILCAGVTVVAVLVTGSGLLIWETRMALRLLTDET